VQKKRGGVFKIIYGSGRSFSPDKILWQPHHEQVQKPEKEMKKSPLFILFIFIITCALHAQSRNAYLIPRQIYVGDPASFVLPLPDYSQDENFVITSYDFDLLPSDPNIDFHRIILERRITGSRLIIEFTPFAAGVLKLPDIEIGGDCFSGFTITVNSLIDIHSAPVLSSAAPTLAMPGTAAMLYGLMAVIVIIILSALWFIFKGRAALDKLREKLKRRRLFKSIRNTQKRLYRALLRGAEKRKILDKLSQEFKKFLSTLTGNNCRAMTAREFIELFSQLPKDLFSAQEDSAYFLGNFFRRCDILRFSGSDIDAQNIFHLLSELNNFICALENKEKDKNKEVA
jgi:hypothetical protein